MAKVVGIDLGTTNSVVAVMEGVSVKKLTPLKCPFAPGIGKSNYENCNKY